MNIVLNKKKLSLIILLCLFFVFSLSIGIYFFDDMKNAFNKQSYNIDKYPNTINWCDTKVVDNTLNVNCKGLLLNINNPNNGDSCFEIQVITEDKELKDLTVCEKGDTLSYTNEVLGYKKLMPVDMVFAYTKEGLLNNYSFSNVSFTKLDDTYVQDIVNEDIANLINIDPTSTTIQNSVDFCPKPEKLPSYVTDTNKVAYTTFYNGNFMNHDEYTDGYLYNWDDSTIRMLFACDSAETRGYTNLCNKNKIQGISSLPSNIDHIKMVPVWGKFTDNSDKVLLKEISLIYDGMLLKNSPNHYIYLKSLSNLVNKVNNSQSFSEEVFCGMYKIYDVLSSSDNYFKTDVLFIKKNLLDNTSVTTSICNGILTESQINSEGQYIKLRYQIQNEIYDRCNNLSAFLK